MTNEERIRAYRLRLSGMTWEAIGARIGYAPMTVRNDLFASLQKKPRAPAPIIYPAIKSACLTRYGGSLHAMAVDFGIADSTLRDCFLGGATPGEKIISCVEEKLGLSYKDAFRR